VKAPSEQLAVLRRLHRWLAVRVALKLSAGGRVSAEEAARNAEEVAAVAWAIGTLDRLLRRARARADRGVQGS
jgi:hypothetical protein